MLVKEKILIVGGGTGALGSVFAAQLFNNSDVTLLVRSPHKARYLKKHGITISGISKVFVPPDKIKILALPYSCSKESYSPPDLVLFLVKSYDTETASRALIPFIGKDTIILTLQNGLGNFETIKKIVSKKFKSSSNRPSVLAGITTYGAMKISDGRFAHTGEGETVIAYDDIKEKFFAVRAAAILSSSGIEGVRAVKSRERLLWSKLIINAAINPVGTVFGITNGEILENDFALNLALGAAREAEYVRRKFFLKKSLPSQPLYRNLPDKIRSVLRLTSANKNSMLQDVLDGRPTEIEAISGAVVRCARALGIDAPINKLLYNSVKILTA